MPQVQLSTNNRHWQVKPAILADQTDPTITDTDPLGDDNVTICKDQNLAKFVFAGSGDNLTASVTIHGWSQIGGGDWMPTLIGKFSLTCGSTTGAASRDFDANDYFVDTITLVDGDDSARIISGVANKIGSLTVDLEGATRVEVCASDLDGSGESTELKYAVSFF